LVGIGKRLKYSSSAWDSSVFSQPWKQKFFFPLSSKIISLHSNPSLYFESPLPSWPMEGGREEGRKEDDGKCVIMPC
jgi:hypothetical protein